MANMHIFSTSLAMEEMQIKVVMNHYYTHIRMVKMKNSDTWLGGFARWQNRKILNLCPLIGTPNLQLNMK